MGCGLWMPRDTYIDTGDTSHLTFTVRIKVKPDATQTAVSPCIVTPKGYFAASQTDFPWDLVWNGNGVNTFATMHDSGNDFSADLTVTSRTGYPAGIWYDIVMVHRASNYVKLWIVPLDNLRSGLWIEVAAGGFNTSARNIWIGRAPFEQSGGVSNSGFIGEVAHYEYWAADMTQGGGATGWLYDWRPPMQREIAAHPDGLGRYIPFDERSGSNVREWCNQIDRSVSGGGHEFRNSLDYDRLRRRVVSTGLRRRAA